MEINLFSLPVYIGNIDCQKIILKNKKFEKTWLSETQSSHNFNNELDVESWNYLAKIISDLIKPHFNFKYSMVLKAIWENHYEEHDYQDAHIHVGSHLSFIIYKEITDAKTVFFHPANKLLESFYMNLDAEIFKREFYPECKSNQIIVFPSCLEHMVKKHSKGTTISGNILMNKLEV